MDEGCCELWVGNVEEILMTGAKIGMERVEW